MKLKLVDKKELAKDTKAFFFEPEKKADYSPGQFFYFTIPEKKMKHKDPRGNTHHFTLFLSPTERDLVSLCTRMRDESGYKNSLDEIKVGEEIEGEGPSGTFILDENEKGPHVLLAGGIGITPFRSIIKYNVDKNLKDIDIHLIYANSVPEEIAFRKELEKWAKENKNINLDMTCSRPKESKQKWPGLKGRIDKKMIKKLVKDVSTPTFWVCGPPGMVDAMEKMLGQIGISADRVRSEKFSGY